MESLNITDRALKINVNHLATHENILWQIFGRSNVYEHIRFLRKNSILPRQYDEFTMSHGAILLAVLSVGRLPQSAPEVYRILQGKYFFEWLVEVFSSDEALKSIEEISHIDISAITGNSKFVTIDGKAIQDKEEPFNGWFERKNSLYQATIKAWYEYLKGFQEEN